MLFVDGCWWVFVYGSLAINSLCVFYWFFFQAIMIPWLTFHKKMWTYCPMSFLSPSSHPFWNNLNLYINVKSEVQFLDPQILGSRWMDVYDILIIIFFPISPSTSGNISCFYNCHRIICKTLLAFFFWRYIGWVEWSWLIYHSCKQQGFFPPEFP